MTRVDLLRMQYQRLIASDADIRLPEGWLGILGRYLDEVTLALAAGDLWRWYVLRNARQRHGALVITTEIGWTALPGDIVVRLHAAEARARLRAQHTCDLCGSRGQTTISEVDGLCVRCPVHRDPEDIMLDAGSDYAKGNVRYRYDPDTDTLTEEIITP